MKGLSLLLMLWIFSRVSVEIYIEQENYYFGHGWWLAIFHLRMHQKMYWMCLDAEDVEGSYFVFMRMHFRICEKASGSIKLCNQAEADVRPMHLDGLKILWPPAGNYQLIGSRFFMNFSWDLYLCTMKPEPRVDDNDIACKDNIKTLLLFNTMWKRIDLDKVWLAWLDGRRRHILEEGAGTKSSRR